MLTPLLVEASKKKAHIFIVTIDSEQLDGESETKENYKIRSTRFSFPLYVMDADMWYGPKTPLPHYGGIADIWITLKFNPDSGFGTTEVEGVFDFGEVGSFKIHGTGYCGGQIIPSPHLPDPIGPVYYQAQVNGYGRGNLQGVSLDLMMTLVEEYPWYFPGSVEKLGGIMFVGEIRY